MAIKKKKNYNEILYELQKQAVLNKTGTSDEELKKQAAKQDFAQEKRYAPITKNNVTSNTYAKTSTKKATTTTTKKSSGGLFSAFDDGYDFGDISRTIVTGGKMLFEGPVKVGKGLIEDPKQTIKSLGVSFAEGYNKASELVDNSVSDIISWITPDSWEKEKDNVPSVLELDKIAATASDEEKQQVLKQYEDTYGKDSPAYQSTFEILYGDNKNIFNTKYYDTETYKKKESGELSEEQQEIYGVGENLGGMAYDYSLGYMTGGMLSPGSTKAIEIASKGSLFLRSQQSATEQAISEGYDEGKARLFGVTVGGFEVGLESIGFDEYGATKELAKKSILKIMGGEALEEFIMPYVESGARVGYFGEEFDLEGTSEEALKSAGLGALTGAIMSAGGRGYAKTDSVINKINSGKEVTENDIISAAKEIEANEPGTIQSVINQGTEALKQDIQTDAQKNITNQINELEGQLDTSMNANQQQEVLNQINTLKEQYDTETQNIAKQKQEQENAERELRRTNFTYDETKITDEVEKSVYDSATKYFNNTARSHEFVERVAKISKDKGTRYSFINNEELQANGLNVEGKQVNGLVRTEQDGKPTILINIDSNKALNTIVGHETTHLLEGTQEYQELQQTIFEYAKTKGDLDIVRNNLTELYKDIENADIDSELTAELVGDYLFTDSKFIDSLAVEKPTLFQKIKDLIDDLVVRFKGTKEERQLRQVQKAFKNAYSVSNSNNIDTKYSVNDNQGRTLTKEQQEYFKDSKVRDEEGRLLEVYHGTNQDFNIFENRDGYYFTDNINNEFITNKRNTIKAYLDIKNPYITNKRYEVESAIYSKDWFRTENGYDYNISKTTGKNLAQLLKEDGYDGIIYNGGYDVDYGDNNYKQFVAFDSNQIKNIDNTNPTTDADIRYSLTPEYGMQHRPSTDYGDASNFEENMPDVFEHPEWYMFGGDDWYKKSYRESLNALRKVRNNPDGEITIYRATIGDTFNEGDWVSPSKTYAEWHNYSNLDGKGKVIELKVKAKDIRFAGDDLNEFGYFPNGVDEYSLSKFNEQRAEAKGNYNVYGEDVKLQVEEAIAPLQEKIETLTERLDTVVNSTEQQEIAPVEQVSTQPTKAELDNLMALQETGGTEYANEFFRLRDKYGQPKLYKGINEYKKSPNNYGMIEEGSPLTEADLDEFYNQSSEEFNTITDEDAPMPMEDTTPDYDYEMPKVESPLEDRNIEEVGNRKVKAYQYENPEVRPYFQEAALGMLYDLNNTTKGERIYNDEVYYNTNGEEGWTGVKRQTTDDIADLLDNFNYSYADIRKGLEAIIKDNGAENIAVAKRIEFALDDRLRNGYTSVDGLEMPANQEYIDLLRGKEIADYYNSIPIEDIAPIDESLEENSVIVPETKNVAENVLKTSHEEIVAKPETTEGTNKENLTVKKSTNPIKPKTKGSTRDTLNYLFINRNEAIDRFAKETGNNNIKFLADHVNNVSGEISTNINKAQIDNEGRVIGKSIVDIFNQARKAKLTEAFDDYLFHLSNKARHKQGKGSLVPLTESKALIIEYEKAYPEMKKWAKEVNEYNKKNLYKQVEAGLYSKEFADGLVEKYEFYVPFFADVLKTYVPSKSNGIKTRGTVRLAEGGANRNLLSFEEAMIRQTQSAITAIRKNQLYQEIVDSSPQVPLGSDADANGLYVDENGYYLTAKYDGENISAYISEDLYKGLENRLGQEIRNIEQKLSGITKPLQAIGNIRRNILTTWSPSFIITNPAKDIQDAPLNSKYAKDWALNYPKAFKELTTGKGEHLQEFLNMYGEAGIMGDYVIDSGVRDATKIAKTKKKLAGITRLNEMLELAPRYAEYLASIKNGTSQMEALYNAREVTTNFGRGGVITKALNRNGFTFLNASVQGFNKLYRNFSGENGAKGVVNASLKAVMLGVVPALFNALSYDDDEDYEALPDYIKDNYYLYKTDDGEFIRIPKGRMMSIFGSAARRALEAAQGEENAFEGYFTNAYSQVGIQNPMESNIFAPLLQAYGSKNGKTWYGTDLVPTRLQDVPVEEQYDESTDKFSIWLGQTFGISPYKVNYVFDQYSGGIGDLLLPTITEEANSDGSFLAPLKDKFVVNSTMDNKYASEFYTKRDKLQVNANSMYATEEDTLMSMYMDEMSWDMSALYKEKREVQNSDLSKKEKYERVQEIQQQINELAEEALNTYDTGTYTDNYASIGNYEFYKGTDYNGNEEWKTVYDYKVEELAELGMTSEEKNEYFGLKQEFDALNNEYYDTKDNLESTYGKHSDEFEDESDELYMEKKNTIIDTIMASNLTDDAKAYLYKEYYSSSAIDTITMSGIPVDYILDYQKNNFKADYNSDGKAIPNSRKNKVIDYVNEFDLSVPEKAIIIKSTNTFKFNDYNNEIVEYVSELDIPDEDKRYILEELDMTIDEEGYVWWKD